MNNSQFKDKYKTKNPIRNQVEFQISSLDSLVPTNHKVRNVWEFVASMDCKPCFQNLKSFKGSDGRSSTSPLVLLALWIYSIMDGNLSARKLETLCKEHIAYKWIAGGVPINRTTLSEFRTLNPLIFEDLLTNTIAVMLQVGLINDTDFAQDGTKIKANAGYNSYRKEKTLELTKQNIKTYIAELKADYENSYDKSKQNRKLRIAKERLERVEDALKILESEKEVRIENGNNNGSPPSQEDLDAMRASKTDPRARKMKMGDGGYRLAYNIQLATGMTSRVIFGVDVVTTLDQGTSPYMMARVHNRLKTLGMVPPKSWIADAAYSAKHDVEMSEKTFPNCLYYAPPKTRKNIDPKKHLKRDSKAIKKWRDLIGTAQVKILYKLRCSTAEFSNAQMKKRGFRELMVRGIEKVKSSTILNAIVQNIERFFSLSKFSLKTATN